MLLDETITDNILIIELKLRKTKGLFFLIKHAADDILEKTLIAEDLTEGSKIIQFPAQYGIEAFTEHQYALLTNTPSFQQTPADIETIQKLKYLMTERTPSLKANNLKAN